MARIDYRKIPVRELYLYMNLVMGFCTDMRRLLRERNLTAEAIDKYEMTAVNNLIVEVNHRSQAAPEQQSGPTTLYAKAEASMIFAIAFFAA